MNNEMRSIIERYESIVKEMHLTLETMERLKVDSKHISEIHSARKQRVRCWLQRKEVLCFEYWST